MTADEFAQWHRHYRTLYPQTDRWMDALGVDEHGESLKRLTLERWRRDFAATGYPGTLFEEAADRLYERPEQPDWQRHGWYLCQIAHQIARERAPAATSYKPDQTPRATPEMLRPLLEAVSGIGTIPGDETEDETRMRRARHRARVEKLKLQLAKRGKA